MCVKVVLVLLLCIELLMVCVMWVVRVVWVFDLSVRLVSMFFISG